MIGNFWSCQTFLGRHAVTQERTGNELVGKNGQSSLRTGTQGSPTHTHRLFITLLTVSRR